jgi:hypothetical protein
MPEWFWPRSKPEAGAMVRLGRSLHWLGYGTASVFSLLAFGASLFGNALDHPDDLAEGIVMILAIAGIGRLARYIMAGE